MRSGLVDISLDNGDLRVGYPKAMGQRTIYERAACGAISVVVTPSLVKKLR
jgi:hypothetical protein